MSIQRALACLASVCAVTAAHAAPLPSVGTQRLDFQPGGASGLVAPNARLMPKRTLRFALAADWEHDPLLIYLSSTRTGAAIHDRFTLHLAAAWGITDSIEVGAEIPGVLVQRGDDLRALGVSPPSSRGLGSPLVQGRFALARSAQSGVDVALRLGARLPLGSRNALVYEPGGALLGQLEVGVPLQSWLHLGLAAGGLWRRAVQVNFPNATRPDVVGSQLDGSALLATVNPGLRGELGGVIHQPLTRLPRSGELFAGARYPLGQVELFGLAATGVGRTPGTPAYRVVAGVAWQPPLGPSCEQGKPHLARDCPTLDLDEDGVQNVDDACPTDPGDASYQGCPIPDSDGDGVADRDDACPIEKGLPERKGCPVRDADQDGVEDADDACPAEAGPPERKGCPVRDADGDGLEDSADACPAEAGTPDRKGCPFKDADQDGVEDSVDNCPQEAGPADNQGCPKAKKQLVIITREKLEIRDKVYFASGKSAVLRRSFPLLDQVASVLVAHPELKRVRVEGHTDSQGSVDRNRTLSQERAEAVRTYLIDKGGVAPERLEAVGYGPDRPAQSNLTAKGREANRRVEFVIVDEPTAQP